MRSFCRIFTDVPDRMSLADATRGTATVASTRMIPKATRPIRLPLGPNGR